MTNRQKVLQHLIRHCTITPVEALIVHKVQRLAPRIHELRKAGYVIDTVEKRDDEGTRYFQYVMPLDQRLPNGD